jgi:hypothetical protein
MIDSGGLGARLWGRVNSYGCTEVALRGERDSVGPVLLTCLLLGPNAQRANTASHAWPGPFVGLVGEPQSQAGRSGVEWAWAMRGRQLTAAAGLCGTLDVLLIVCSLQGSRRAQRMGMVGSATGVRCSACWHVF